MTTSLFAKPATLTFGSSLDNKYYRPSTTSTNDEEEPQDFDATLILGRKDDLELLLPKGGGQDSSNTSMLEPLGLSSIPTPILSTMMDGLSAKMGGSSSTLITLGDKVHKFILCGLPTEQLSRNNHPMSVHKITKYMTDVCPAKGITRVVMVVHNNESKSGNGTLCSVGPLASAIAKAFPLFSMKTTAPKTEDGDSSPQRTVHVIFVQAPKEGETSPKELVLLNDPIQLNAVQAVVSGVQLSARLVDSHPELLTTTQFATEVETLVSTWNEKSEESKKIKLSQIIGDDLLPYGGLHGVGKAATCPPRMMILEYNAPPPSTDNDETQKMETIALVGKGIVYDTGGLSLKSKVGMCTMKQDMGGAAGVFGGFMSAVQCGTTDKHLICILCLAENAIGPLAFRNDDILQMYSGKTVEVNNCDAEGRLVLADGVAHATKHYSVDLVLDMATLTGAQMVATGRKHAGTLANTLELEHRIVAAGLNSGDFCFPMLYAPELLMEEFKSEVADMKNSVKDRSNAQSSCAGHFIEAHLDSNYKGGWIHVDMAGPAASGARGTGYGVGLILKLVGAPGF